MEFMDIDIEYIKDFGTPKRLKKINIEQKNINNKVSAVFLDRDGVINKENGVLILYLNLKFYQK